MGRIRRFQRTMLTALTGINTFVFGTSNGLSTAYAFLFCAIAMSVVLVAILIYSGFRKHKKKKQVLPLRIPK